MTSPHPDDDSQLQWHGDPQSEWLVRQKSWLRILAGQELNRRLAGKVDPSDLVQQTMLEAWKGRDQLRATDDAARLAWLRKVLTNQLALFLRHYRGTQKRTVDREVSLAQSLEHSSRQLESMLAASGLSPSQLVAVDEQRVRLTTILDQLPEDYRQVILLRNLEELSHREVALRMGRSEPAVRMLWVRALAELSQRLRDAESKPSRGVERPIDES